MKDRRTVIKGAVAVAAAGQASMLLAQAAPPAPARQGRDRPFLTERTLSGMLADPGRSREIGAGLAKDPRGWLAATFRLTPVQIEAIKSIPQHGIEELQNFGRFLVKGAKVTTLKFNGSGEADGSGTPIGRTASVDVWGSLDPITIGVKITF